ncbi:protein FAM167A isoform X1 [Hyalella azteca]|uniref:Protein FAM167A isoform X1 n=1 Tax=Hyalella azteca TaxID=294128 RepID=A0A979FGC8_HYAAZ|nr:protein FAM167A isoform X1 [Hyalella azteca]
METLERSGEDKAAPPEEEIEKARLKDKRLFKTKLSLNLKMPLLRRDSRSKLLRKIDEESESIILQDGQIVRLRSTSTSSSRSYNGEIAHAKLCQSGSCSSFSSGSPADFSLPATPDSPALGIEQLFTLRQNSNGSLHSSPSASSLSEKISSDNFTQKLRNNMSYRDYSTPSTPESPTPDIDNLFAQRLRVTMSSPDSMAHVKALAHKLKFNPNASIETNEFKIRKKLLDAQSEEKTAVPVCVVEDRTDDGEEEGVVLSSVSSEEEKKENLQRSLDWIRNELQAMKEQDQHIARQLITIRLEIQRIRLQRTVVGHKTILENVAVDTQEEKEWFLGGVEPPDHLQFVMEPPRAFLRDMGLTKLNITKRRFSLR